MALQIGEALFTFEPEEETEIAIFEGEEVKIYNADVGEGWVEGENLRGERGIFPKNYVRITNDVVPQETSSPEVINQVIAIQANPAKSAIAVAAVNSQIYDEAPESVDDNWGEYTAETVQASNATKNNPPAYNSPNGEDQALPTQHFQNTKQAQNLTSTSAPSSATQSNNSHNYTEDDESVAACLGRYLNRFTFFVKSQSEDYILGTLHASQKSPAISDQLQIVQYGQDGPIWAPANTPFTIQVNNYSKGDSRGVFAPHLYYQISKDTSPNSEVKRKYEHFEWLIENFRKKFPIALLPTLPNKVPIDEVQLQKQIKMLNIWAEQVSNNPMLQQSKLIEHFMTIEDKKLFTKARKQSDGDKVILGANYKVCEIESSAVISVSSRGDGELKRSVRLHEALGTGFAELCRATGLYQDHCIKYVSPPVTLFEQSCKKLGDSLVEHRTFGTYELGQAFQQASEVVKDINADITTKPKQAYIDFSDRLWVHRKKLEGWPNLLNINELSIEKFKDAATWQAKRHGSTANKLDTTTAPGTSGNDPAAYNDKLVEIVKNRCDRVVTVTQAEINHHTLEMVKDSKQIMQQYLEKQIEMHKEMMEKYKKALDYFSNIPEL